MASVMRLRLCSVALSCMLGCAAYSQTIYGPGGLIINPTAYMDPKGTFQLNASFFNRQIDGTTSFYPVSATYTPSKSFEYGVVYLGKYSNPTHFDQGGVFLKQALLTEGRAQPAVALVGSSLQGGGNFSNLTLIASKEVVKGLRLHVGARGLSDTHESTLDGNLIVGTDFSIGEHFRLIAEADSRLHEFTAGSQAYGVQYQSPAFTTTLGVVAQATTRFSFFVGIGFPITKP